jgi:hypothetical protein
MLMLMFVMFVMFVLFVLLMVVVTPLTIRLEVPDDGFAFEALVEEMLATPWENVGLQGFFRPQCRLRSPRKIDWYPQRVHRCMQAIGFTVFWLLYTWEASSNCHHKPPPFSSTL